ncbi:siroheme synthase CysG [Pseudaeromonas sharmana]|uniref:Siroheme synthase n=1 Tax=Pseudaeromonas sharmana TaxID=328412 RepID=A0ABV8CRL1_9GAMM
MDYLPLFANVAQRPVLLVGGGEVALRKARLLLEADASVTVVAPDLHEELHQLQQLGRIIHQAELFQASHLHGQRLVIAATDDEQVNADVAAAAEAAGLWVNVVDDPARSSFIFPSIIDRSPIIVAISSGGAAPVLARLLRERLEALLPGHLGQLARLSGQLRERVKSALTSLTQRRRFWERVFASGQLASLLRAGETEQGRQWMETALQQGEQEGGELVLVGAGPGDAGLLTLKGLQQIQQAEVVLYDQLVSPEVLNLVRRDAERICVGKKAGAHSVPQAEINALLVEHALAGKRVVRLKGGDPFMFGRGAEELEAARDAGIAFSVVPGITAAAGATAYAGIPLTHRDHAQSAVFITGHCQQDGREPDWPALAASNQTLVIYMGLIASPVIQQRLLSHGRAPTTPVALIERGTTAEQKVWRGELQHLAELASGAASPSLIVVGEVAALADQLSWFRGEVASGKEHLVELA